MSNFMYTANGSRISNKQRIIEGMADTNTNSNTPTDFLNLAGNLRLAGSVRATNFYKEDGTELQSVTVNKLALPENVYYVDKKLGINQDKPIVDFDVKGKARVLGELGVDGSMGVSGKFGVQGPAIFKNTVTVEDEFITNKHTGVRGNLGVGGDFNARGLANFAGPVTMENDFVAGKSATIGGNFSAQGLGNFKGALTSEDDFFANKSATVGGNFNTKGTSNFVGKVTAEDDFAVNKNAFITGNSNVGGDITFNGANKWIIHTPDDNRRVMYMAPGNDKGEWMWDKQTQFYNNGNVQLSGGLMLGTQNIEHSDAGDGAFYRADGQLQIATDDLIRLRHVGTKQTGIQFDVRGDKDKPGDIQNPNGQTKISRWGIMFGGDNNGREVNSAQISAGALEPDSLNIVGMSKDKEKSSRRVDMFAEGGFRLNGSMFANAPASDANGQQIVIGNVNESNLRLGRHADYSWIQSHAGKPLRINPLGNQVIMNPDTGFCVGSTCLTEAALQKLMTPATSSTSTNKLSENMYYEEDAEIYINVYDAIAKSVIAKSGSPAGWDDGSFKTNPWNGRQLLKIGNKNAFPNGLLVNVSDGKNVIWISVLSDRFESFDVYTSDGKSLGNFTSGFRLTNRINPNGSTISDNPNFHTWMPIPVPGPGKYVICGGNKKNDGGNDCWISGIAFSTNPWAHAMNSAVAYHWLVNEGTPNPTLVSQNDRGDNNVRLDKGKAYTLMVPVVKSGKDKMLYFVLNTLITNAKISVNDKPVDNLQRTNNNPFAKFFNSVIYNNQPFNYFVSTKVPADLVQASGFLKVTVDLTGLNNDINFREIGTIDMA